MPLSPSRPSRRRWSRRKPSKLLHEAGVPPTALHLVPGDGRIGAALVAHPDDRRRGLHRLDRGGALDQPHARRQGWPDRAADRRDRRHQRHDRGRHRAARTGRRRRRHLGVPFRRPALLGAAALVRAGRRRRSHDRDDRGRRARTEARRRLRSRDPCRARDRRRGQGEAGRAYRADETRGARAFRRHRAGRQFRRAAYLRAERRRPAHRGGVRPDPACGAL